MRLKSLCLAMIVALLLPATPAGADHPYAADPLGLVPFINTTQQVYSTGTDTWEVWVCQVANGDTPVDLNQITTDLNAEMQPYFQWLSNGRYLPRFVAGGEVSSTDVIPPSFDSPEPLFAPDCKDHVATASAGEANGALIVVDAGFDEGYSQSGLICPEAPFSGCTVDYPSNGRSIVLGAATVTTVAPFTQPQWVTVAHELGHALNWPHSYGGLTFDPDTQLVDRYDNPMDVMSGAVLTNDPIGTIAYHRYAAGWIDPADVAVHEQGVSLHELAAVGDTGTQLLILPGPDLGYFYALGARRRSAFDVNIPKAGVEIYQIDQRREVACDFPDSWPPETATWPCFATLVRIAQTPAIQGRTGTAHVLTIDESVTVGRYTVTVLAATTTSFTVRVSEIDSGTFTDDDGNPFEPQIEKIAQAGITKGCNPPSNDRYCPTTSVTRAEMAAFLIRALGWEDSMIPFEDRFADVPAGQWYTPYVETLAALGITTGYPDGTYRPGAAVSRAEMAAFLARAFDDPTTLAPGQGLFSDIPLGAWYIEEAEKIYELGITLGCDIDPLRYCPNAQVKRDQMAAFLARALGL
jgi:hypothetical protein